MAKSPSKSELLKRLNLEKEKAKEARTIYVSKEVWSGLVEWCEDQDPAQKPSRVIEELIKMNILDKK